MFSVPVTVAVTTFARVPELIPNSFASGVCDVINLKFLKLTLIGKEVYRLLIQLCLITQKDLFLKLDYISENSAFELSVPDT